jgi:hypothetical protein
MANKTGAFGLRPVRYRNGTPYNGACEKVYISASDTTALFVGDPVVYEATLARKDATAKYLTVEKAANVVLAGVIVGFEPDPTNLELKHRLASTERWAYIALGGELVYEIRGDTTAPTAVFPGQNAEMTHGSGSTVTGLSGTILDTTTPATTQTFPLHILGIKDVADNELLGSCVYEVILNTYPLATGNILGVTAS